MAQPGGTLWKHGRKLLKASVRTPHGVQNVLKLATHIVRLLKSVETGSVWGLEMWLGDKTAYPSM